MTIDAPCPNCGTVYTVRRELIGKRTKCTRCGTPFVIVEGAPFQPQSTNPPPPPDHGLFSGIPTHPSYSAHQVPPQGSATPQRSSASEIFGFERDAARPKFQAMRTVAMLYQFCGFAVLFIAVCWFLAFVVQIIREPQHFWINTFAYGTGFAALLINALLLFFASQSIRLWLQIEQNTRETSEACRRLADHLTAIQTEQ